MKRIEKIIKQNKDINIFLTEIDNILESQKMLDLDEIDIFLNKRFKKLGYFSLNLVNLLKYFKYLKVYNIYTKKILNLKNALNNHNEKIAKELINNVNNIIGLIEGHELDYDQKNAIVRTNKNQLVLAAAGSGKSTTIIGKVKYLINTNQYSKDEILVLSFTRKSAEEMKERLFNEIGEYINVSTFHRLGLDIIKECEEFAPNVYDKNISQFIKSSLENAIKDKNYKNNIYELFKIYIYDFKDEFSFSSEYEYKEYLKKNAPKTMKGDQVKSYGELEIANFLYENGIKYIYEEEYKYSTKTKNKRQYIPDFYLPDYGIYIEYFGIDKNGNVPSYYTSPTNSSPSKEYNDSIKWKRKIHDHNKTKMIECYYYEKRDNTLLANLEKKLKDNNVQFIPLSDEEKWKIIDKKKTVINDISKTIQTAINLMKSNNISIDYLKRKFNNKEINKELLYSLNIIIPIYNEYNDYLEKNNYIDFNDMINKAASYVSNNKYTNKFKYILVDEYQDISYSRYNLLSELRKNNYYKIFCVGDDWQSIYQFAGSDVGLIMHFNKYFGKTFVSSIPVTYRFSNQLASITSKFISKNPCQIEKDVKGKESKFSSIGLIKGYTEEKSIDFMIEKIDNCEKNASIFIIGRNNFDIDMLSKNSNFSFSYNINMDIVSITYSRRKDLKISFLTAHKSKGLQADYVFIINNINLIYGFPNKITDNILVKSLKSIDENYPYAEERRLFYVAMTRSRIKTYLITINNKESIFINELEKEYNSIFEKERYECPICGNRLKKIEYNNSHFFGCSNYPECKYTRNIERYR